ncbi:MAG: D-alanyl-D-alanine carboxypeptidase, partial [Planctomycetota bacterium]
WIAELPNAKEVTVLQLLRHQTGIPRYVFEDEFTSLMAGEPERMWKPEELLAFVSDARPLFAPGEGWAYSDTNYIVLGLIIEKVSGTTFYDYVREHFVDRFKLTHTLPTDRTRLPNMAQGHVVMGRSMGVPERTLIDGVFAYNVQFEWCGGGWASTPADLARWTRILYAGHAVDGPYLDTLLDAVPAAELGPGARYGLGVILRDTPAGPAIGHDGFMPGYLTALAWYPEANVAGAIQLNCDDGRAVGRPLAQVLAELAQIAAEELAR